MNFKLRSFFILFAFSVFVGSSIEPKKKTNSPPKVSGYELVSNPSAAFGKTIQISGTVSEILYKGNSIRFWFIFPVSRSLWIRIRPPLSPTFK